MQISRILPTRKITSQLSQLLFQFHLQVFQNHFSKNSYSVSKMSDGLTGSTILQQVMVEYGRPDIVKIQNKSNVEDILGKIYQQGSKSLQVVTDFDQTITRHHLNGEPCEMCHGVLAYSPEMPEDFRQETEVLFKKFYPIEISAKLTEEEKLPSIIEWYEISHKLIVETGIEKSFLERLVQHSKCFLRDNAIQTFKTLHEQNIPVLIFSAGLGDILEIILKQNNISYPNIKVISNYMEFDATTGKICGFKMPLIHILNKNETVLAKNNNYFMDLTHRENALLLGDNLGDSNMCAGMKKSGSVLKIGFLNEKIEERLPTFMNTFDIVLCDDQSMDFVNLLLKHLLRLK